MPHQTKDKHYLFNFSEGERESFNLLQRWFENAPGIVLAFSGGIDSALTLRLAVHFLGTKLVVPVIGVSPSLSRRELDFAIGFAADLGCPAELLSTKEFENPQYLENNGSRCYYCKSTLFSTLRECLMHSFPGERADWWVVDGTNADDLCEVRPGLKASEEFLVRHPLADCGLNKNTIRSLARAMGLAIWNKPASPCLSSRVVVGTSVSLQKIKMIEQAEEILRQEGLMGFRVRLHESGCDSFAKIELGQSDLDRLNDPRFVSAMISSIAAVGFVEVVFDPNGYHSPGEKLRVLGQERSFA